jgi:hypothetical protein
MAYIRCFLSCLNLSFHTVFVTDVVYFTPFEVMWQSPGFDTTNLLLRPTPRNGSC